MLRYCDVAAWWSVVAIEAGEGKQFLPHCYANKSTPQLFHKVLAQIKKKFNNNAEMKPFVAAVLLCQKSTNHFGWCI